MIHRYQWAKFVCASIALALALGGGCSPNFHKTDADKEVYNIINSKWRNNFGQKANYVISDANSIATPNDVNVDKIVIPQPLSLAQAVALATKYNRGYQNDKEALYQRTLDLTGIRYIYALKWFGTIDVDYAKEGEDPEVKTAKSEFGVSKRFLTPEGIIVNSSLVINWARFLTGDPRTTLASIIIL